jgi:hypothetical protein
MSWMDVTNKLDNLTGQIAEKVDKYELHKTDSNVASLECAIGEIRSALDGIRIELQKLQEDFLNHTQEPNE